MYSNQIETLRRAVVLAKDQHESAQDHMAEFQAEQNWTRAQTLLARAELCDEVLERLRWVGKAGDLRDATNAILNLNGLTTDEMHAVLWFGSEWGNHLYNSGLHHGEKPASLYQIEIVRKSDQETFYKVGHTGADLTKRINALGICRKTYVVSIHHSIQFRKKRYAEAEEKRIHDQNAHLRYLGAPFLDNGHTEVYSAPILSNRLRLEISLYSLLGISRD